MRKKHKLEVKIPAGVERGTRLRITGAGEAGINGGLQGDFYLLIDVKPDKAFERDGADLHTRLLSATEEVLFECGCHGCKLYIIRKSWVPKPFRIISGTKMKIGR